MIINKIILASFLAAAIFGASPLLLRADNYTVDQGGTVKTPDVQKTPPKSDSPEKIKSDDSHDRSETDAGHGKSNQSLGAGGDVLIDQSTFKNREKPVYIPPTN